MKSLFPQYPNITFPIPIPSVPLNKNPEALKNKNKRNKLTFLNKLKPPLFP